MLRGRRDTLLDFFHRIRGALRHRYERVYVRPAVIGGVRIVSLPLFDALRYTAVSSGRGDRLDQLLQPSPDALDTGLCQSNGVREKLACQNSGWITRKGADHFLRIQSAILPVANVIDCVNYLLRRGAALPSLRSGDQTTFCSSTKGSSSK